MLPNYDKGLRCRVWSEVLGLSFRFRVCPAFVPVSSVVFFCLAHLLQYFWRLFSKVLRAEWLGRIYLPSGVLSDLAFYRLLLAGRAKSVQYQYTFLLRDCESTLFKASQTRCWVVYLFQQPELISVSVKINRESVDQ